MPLKHSITASSPSSIAPVILLASHSLIMSSQVSFARRDLGTDRRSSFYSRSSLRERFRNCGVEALPHSSIQLRFSKSTALFTSPVSEWLCLRCLTCKTS